ncbi:phage tail tube protein [Natronoglomus mannanivorans]|uniref:Phage tail tube protein n=1 Tax=Natronoglomus mannanivorans TaxID=2979990 RepID=A0AAP2Z1F3_9EURY|nr:phage tail tube protein [Halobacteria archaeon AArc-xg1-1]
MSANRYALAGEGGLTYGVESSPYEQAADATTDPGITNEDIDPPNPNEHTAMSHGGTGRVVFLNSPDEKDYEFDVPTVVHDENAPFEIALGSRTETDEGDYTSVLFEEASRLPTATFRHFQADLDFVSYYVGCKANLGIEWGQGDPLQATFSVTAAQLGYDDTESPGSYPSGLDTSVSPYRAHMAGDLTLSEPDGGGIIKDIATVNSGSFNWDNGLEAQHHGGDPGREAYAVAETTAAEGRYDWSITPNITDTDLFERAYQNDDPVDVEQPFVRQDSNGTIVDGVIVRGKRCTITDAPIPSPSEGVLEGDISLLPESTEIEIRVPN